MFFKGSRYKKVGEAEGKDAAGRTVRYKRIRIIPPAKATRGHIVHQSERLDHIAHRYYRDPELFWRICDANEALWPDDLTSAPGRIIKIPPAED